LATNSSIKYNARLKPIAYATENCTRTALMKPVVRDWRTSRETNGLRNQIWRRLN